MPDLVRVRRAGGEPHGEVTYLPAQDCLSPALDELQIRQKVVHSFALSTRASVLIMGFDKLKLMPVSQSFSILE